MVREWHVCFAARLSNGMEEMQLDLNEGEVLMALRVSDGSHGEAYITVFGLGNCEG